MLVLSLRRSIKTTGVFHLFVFALKTQPDAGREMGEKITIVFGQLASM